MESQIHLYARQVNMPPLEFSFFFFLPLNFLLGTSSYEIVTPNQVSPQLLSRSAANLPSPGVTLRKCAAATQTWQALR